MVRQLQSLSHFSKNVCSVTTNNSLTRVVVTYWLDYRPGKSFRSWLPRKSWLFKQKLLSNGSANSQPRTFSKLHSNSIKLMFCPWFVSTSWTLKLSHKYQLFWFSIFSCREKLWFFLNCAFQNRWEGRSRGLE